MYTATINKGSPTYAVAVRPRRPADSRAFGSTPFGGVNRLAIFFFSVFVFSIPWDEQAPMSIPHGQTFCRFLGVAAFAFAMLALGMRFRLRSLSAAHYPLFAFVAWAFLSLLWTLSPELTAERVSSYTQLAVMAWLCWEIAPEKQQQAILLRAYVLGTAVSAIGTLSNFAHGHAALSRGIGGLQHTSEIEQGRYVASGFNENELSLILALSIPMSCYLIVSTRNKWWVTIYICQITCTVMAIILTGSRGGFLSTLVAVSIFPLLSFRFTLRQKLGAIAIGAIVVISAVSIVPKATWDRLLSTKSELEEGTLTKRTIIWRAGMDVLRDHPFAGVGAGAYTEAVSGILDVPYAAHNTFLSILIETGFIGAAIFGLWAIALCRCIYFLEPVERRLWIVLLAAWALGVSAMTWEHRKTTWFLFGTLTAAAATRRRYCAVRRGNSGRYTACKPVI